MAFRPSLRSSRSFDEAKPNLFPVMNLMVVLIPLLLSTATYVRIGVIELDLPPAAGGPGEETVMPVEEERTLNLAVIITEQGFYLSSAASILRDTEGGGPSIPKIVREGSLPEYNYQALTDTLFRIKSMVQGQFSDSENIIIQAERQVRYQVLINTMDAARSIIRDGQRYQLFPRVSLSMGIL